MPTDEAKTTTPLPYAAGLDVHQKTISVAVLDPGGQLVHRRTIRTCPKMLDELDRDLRKLASTTPVILGLEASTAGKAVFQHLRGRGCDVRMAHPKKLKALLGDTKTDENDALMLATVLRLGTFPEAYVPPPEIESLRTLVRLRGEVVEKLRRAKIQVRSLLVKHHLQHEGAKYNDIFGVQALRWLRDEVKLSDPWDQRQLVFLLEEGALLARQQYELTTELARVATTRNEVRILQSVPGIDYTLALTIVAEVGEIQRFPNRKKFAAYCGLVPKNRASGEKDPQHTKRRHGNSQLTYAFEMAVSAIRQMGRGRFFVQLKALEKRLGVPKAITAVAHRLAFTVYGLWKKGALYEETAVRLYSSKRRRMATRAAESVTTPSLADHVETLIGLQGYAGVAR
ncbi:MAG TPA: IS110 family transposase [Thermoplasmata archaeon]|nr:IS110 family transposase [Thermoplasmata archaeon]